MWTVMEKPQVFPMRIFLCSIQSKGVYEWQYINGDSTATMKVAPGEYDLSYWIDQRSGWFQEPVDEKVTTESGKTVTKDDYPAKGNGNH